ncbi:glycosyltransferase family A protein [Spirosoma pulveris]
MITPGLDSREFPDNIHDCAPADQANLRVSASRIVGIPRATGDLIAFLDADDVWLPEKLAAQVAIHQQHPSAGSDLIGWVSSLLY